MGNTINIKGKEYTKVVNRLKDFRDTFPANETWAIKTEPISITNESVVFQATINNPDGVTVAVGHGHNLLGADKALEKAETVAIGRAIGNFHPVYGGESDEFASADEMQKFQENQVITKDDGDFFPQEQAVKPTNGDGAVLWPFNGKYKDQPVTALDQSYCTWALTAHEQLKEPSYAPLRSAVEAHLQSFS